MLNAAGLPLVREASIARRAIWRGRLTVSDTQEFGILILAVISLVATIVLPVLHQAVPGEVSTILAGAIFFYFGRISNAVLVPRPPAASPPPAPPDHGKGV